MKRCEIEGGATLWARKTIDSEIFEDKPHVWFKIWFYLVNRASHKDTKKYKRGETFYQQAWICEKTKASPDQLKKCLTWLRDEGMISTRRSTRGTKLIIPKYSYFQNLDNYYYNVKAPEEAREKHERSTTEARRYNKNVKNDKNVKNTISYNADKSAEEIPNNLYILKDKSEWKNKPSATQAGGSQVPENTEPSARECNSQVPDRHTKETHSIRKHIEGNTYYNADKKSAEEIPKIIKLFEEVNPSVYLLYGRKPQREAVARMLKKYTFDGLAKMVQSLQITNKEKYAPTITTPCQLEENIGKLKSYWQGRKTNKPKFTKIS